MRWDTDYYLDGQMGGHDATEVIVHDVNIRWGSLDTNTR
jgi:hypothetical protein